MQEDKRTEQPATVSPQVTQPKKAWQKPRVQQLRISLDTAGGGGSNTDAFGGSLPL
ncbi:MAG: hypothetical protein IPM53_02025 [Anaerolineaceae bacterium]|nr:hypothetical protein [Anaerolineaceae bacterium]